MLTAMNKSIKNILLDLGGVICDLDWEKMSQSFKNLSPDNESVNRKALELELYIRFETGLISEEEFIFSGKRLLGSHVSEQQFIEAWNSILSKIPSSRIELLKKLGTRYNLFLLSNTNVIHHRYIDEEILYKLGHDKLESFFQKIFMSYEIKIRKPDLECFHHVVNTLDLPAKEILFIDDDEKNTKTAIEAGMQSHFLDLNKEKLENAVFRLGLL